MIDQYYKETLPQLLQELDDVYQDVSAVVEEAFAQGTDVISLKSVDTSRRYEGLTLLSKNIKPSADLNAFVKTLNIPDSMTITKHLYFSPPQVTVDHPQPIPLIFRDEIHVDRVSQSSIRNVLKIYRLWFEYKLEAWRIKLYNKVNELQEDISLKRFDLRIANLHLAAIQSQKELFATKCETSMSGLGTPPSSASGSTAAVNSADLLLRERKLSSSSGGTTGGASGGMKNKWKDKELATLLLRLFLETNHIFQEYTYKKITPCDVCSQILRGHTRQGMKCKLCRLNVHPDCQEKAAKCQPKTRLLRRQKSASELDPRIGNLVDEDIVRKIENRRSPPEIPRYDTDPNKYDSRSSAQEIVISRAPTLDYGGNNTPYRPSFSRYHPGASNTLTISGSIKSHIPKSGLYEYYEPEAIIDPGNNNTPGSSEKVFIGGSYSASTGCSSNLIDSYRGNNDTPKLANLVAGLIQSHALMSGGIAIGAAIRPEVAAANLSHLSRYNSKKDITEELWLNNAPSSPVQSRRPGQLRTTTTTRMSSVELPDEAEKSVSSASTSPCPSPKPNRFTLANVFVVLYNFKPRHADELDLKAGQMLTVIDTSDKDWWKGKCLGSIGFFPSTYVNKLLPGEKPFQIKLLFVYLKKTTNEMEQSLSEILIIYKVIVQVNIYKKFECFVNISDPDNHACDDDSERDEISQCYRHIRISSRFCRHSGNILLHRKWKYHLDHPNVIDLNTVPHNSQTRQAGKAISAQTFSEIVELIMTSSDVVSTYYDDEKDCNLSSASNSIVKAKSFYLIEFKPIDGMNKFCSLVRQDGELVAIWTRLKDSHQKLEEIELALKASK
ncbi:unnamed protein product [Lepeophtheirus salmonis]|uniref:(salmon louse) hypothetical protein n=1 Tax=Lepeophtheirus salmonis TaxID=72036 RepID=A0A7R8HBE3_LEPSM|nr:unnamed protein product [Lepeophtheirus salmonis]CAF2985621.1 unnamed protein product [Lepeophtheirus salmonis]